MRRLHGPREIQRGRHDLVAFCLVKNGATYLRSFVEHHLRLGIKHIVFLDNGSVDGTVELAQDYDCVTVLESRLPFATQKNTLRRSLVQAYSRDRWALYLDIDERFDYPGSQRLKISALLGYLDAAGYSALVAQMVDVFPRDPLLAIDQAAEAADLAAYHCYYSPYWLRPDAYQNGRGNVVSNPDICTLRGGVRGAMFDLPGLLLTKHPLFLLDGRTVPYQHGSHSIEGARVADFNAVLVHTKFTRTFPEQLARALSEESYANRSWEYRAYERRLRLSPDLRLWSARWSRRLVSTEQLAGTPLLVASARYREFAGEWPAKNLPGEQSELPQIASSTSTRIQCTPATEG